MGFPLRLSAEGPPAVGPVTSLRGPFPTEGHLYGAGLALIPTEAWEIMGVMAKVVWDHLMQVGGGEFSKAGGAALEALALCLLP